MPDKDYLLPSKPRCDDKWWSIKLLVETILKGLDGLEASAGGKRYTSIKLWVETESILNVLGDSEVDADGKRYTAIKLWMETKRCPKMVIGEGR